MPVVKVRGLTELRQALTTMSKSAPRELAKANKRVAAIVVPEAQRLAPKGKHEGGGSIVPIASSIKAVQSAAKVSIAAGGAGTPHAAAYEFGGYIPRRGAKGLNRRGKVAARLRGGAGILTHIKKHPYLIPAVEHKIDAVVTEYRQAIDILIAKFGR